MQKPVDTSRWWDWASVALLLVLLQIVASRLVATAWTPFLSLTQSITYIGFIIGVALGYTRYSQRIVRWISFSYMIVLLPLQWLQVVNQAVLLEDQLLSIRGRLLVSFTDFFAHRPVEDPFFFVAVVTMIFWIISASAGFHLVRNQNYLVAVIPSTVGLLVIQGYDGFVPSRVWYIAFFAFIALLLLGRLNLLANKESWTQRRIFLSADSQTDLTGSMLFIVSAIIIIAWIIPPSVSSMKSAARQWQQATKPWREFTKKLDNAFDALKSGGAKKPRDIFSSELQLGTGFALSDSIAFNVQVPELPDEDNPPRFYWRGRIYDQYQNKKWSASRTTPTGFIPSASPLVLTDANGQQRFHFRFFIGDDAISLLYAPSQSTWVSRANSVIFIPTQKGDDIFAWLASPALEAGESYQVDATINNPNTRDLKTAGTEYPEWVKSRYLQLPENFSPRVQELARQVTDGAKNPYEQATLLTQYLRQSIEYSATVDKAPDDVDPLEWFLFTYKKGYCVYYASAEVLMLRSLGIPARMAVGFAQGEYSVDTNQYIVRRLDAHAWPEVYFPTVGWVEFEPTVSQPPLTRPEPQNNDRTNGNANLPIPLRPDNQNTLDNLTENNVPTPQTGLGAINLRIYLSLLSIIFATLIIYFSRKYSVGARIPVFLRTTIERSGSQPPVWIINWERWVNLSPIEKSFDSVNFGLRLLDNPLPVHATPIERANALTHILPNLENQIKTLLDEHQTSLYTSRSADNYKAQRAAFTIRSQVLIQKIRYFLEGKPERTT